MISGTNPFTLVNTQHISMKGETSCFSPVATQIPGGSRLTNRCLLSLHGRKKHPKKTRKTEVWGKKKSRIPIKPKSYADKKPCVISPSYRTDKDSLMKSTCVANSHFALFLNSQQDVRFCVVSLFNQPHPSLLTGTDSSVTCCVRGGAGRGNVLSSNWRIFPPVDLFTTFNYWLKSVCME